MPSVTSDPVTLASNAIASDLGIWRRASRPALITYERLALNFRGSKNTMSIWSLASSVSEKMKRLAKGFFFLTVIGLAGTSSGWMSNYKRDFRQYELLRTRMSQRAIPVVQYILYIQNCTCIKNFLCIRCIAYA
jgi:hypothetical protein